MKLKEIQMEVSLKAFLRKKAPSFEETARIMFEEYKPLWKDLEKISVLLWTGDGTEILEYSGDPDARFDWCRYLGICNRPRPPERDKADPERRDGWAQQYFEPGHDLTDYRTLLAIVKAVKNTGKKLSGKEILVGNAFDPGPEFAISDFKYKNHRECLRGGYIPRTQELVSCSSILHADRTPYAAFPEGIPEGIPFGRFFGMQFEAFCRGMDMDFIWLSNGFGFGNWPWSMTGEAFDGKNFSPEKAEQEKKDMLVFWKEFSSVCKRPVRVRGTNFGSGADLATDAVPLKEIFEETFLEYPPVNSPWTPINQDVGSEIGGWISHIAGWKKHDILFRFYPHDPWFPTSPWLDRFDRMPYGIYMPFAVSRLRPDGNLDTPNAISFLTVDSCRGEMPEQIPEEMIPHIHQALRTGPDAAGPVVLVYPFEENVKRASVKGGRSSEVLFGELFVRSAINSGVPLNCVTDSAGTSALPDGCTVVSPVPDPGSLWEKNLLAHAEKGNTLLLFGPLDFAGENLKELLGITLGTGIGNDLIVEGGELPVTFTGGNILHHDSQVSQGPVRECGGKKILYTVRSGNEVRTWAAEAPCGKGKIVYMRGSYRMKEGEAFRIGQTLRYSLPDDGIEYGAMFAEVLKFTGWKWIVRRPCERCYYPAMTMHWHENGLYLSGLNRTTPVSIVAHTPFGAPVPATTDLFMEKGDSVIQPEKSFRLECRIFIEQEEDGLVSCVEYNPTFRDHSRFFLLRGLKNALVTILPPEKDLDHIRVNPTLDQAYVLIPELETEKVHIAGKNVRRLVSRVSGNITIAW